VAFKTRAVPSAFNESTHIERTLQLMIFMLIILAPLDWALVNNSPEASIVIQSGGQSLLALFLLLSTVGPKLFYIATGKGSSKSFVFQGPSGTNKHSDRGSTSHASVTGKMSDDNKSTPGGVMSETTEMVDRNTM